MRCLETCADPLEYATLRAEPQWPVLGRRLGKDMGAVGAAVKALTAEQLSAFEREGSITVAGHELREGDLKVLHDFKPLTDCGRQQAQSGWHGL